MENRFGMIYIT